MLFRFASGQSSRAMAADTGWPESFIFSAIYGKNDFPGFKYTGAGLGSSGMTIAAN
jgi:hypothetical protein